MFVKYSPQQANHDTQIEVVDENTLIIDGTNHEFDASVQFPTINTDSGGVILEAHRENGELYVTVFRKYSVHGWPSWDSGGYQQCTPA